MDIAKFLASTQLLATPSTPIYIQIASLLAAKIHDLSLPPGSKLPPERELAALLSVSRTTAINVYRHLEQQQLVQTKIGSGTYVADLAAVAVEPAMPWSQLFVPRIQTAHDSLLKELVSAKISAQSISLAAGMPDPSLYPLTALQELFAQSSSRLQIADFGHLPTEGYEPLRQSLSAFLNTRAIPAQPANTLILTGSKQGMYLLSKILIEPGDYVIVESPTYVGAIQAFQLAGARLLSLPATPSGFSLSLLEDYLLRYHPKLLYLLPTFQNPNGRVISLTERKKILQLAARHRLVIIEDDPYSELYFDQPAPPSLKALDSYGCVLSLGTFSKILFPGLRTGWLVAPEAVTNRIAIEKQHVDLHSNSVIQWLLHQFLQADLLEGHLQMIRQEYKKRRDTAVQALQRFCGSEITFTQPEGGFYLWCKIKPPVQARRLLQEAGKLGVSFVPGEAFYTDSLGADEFRLCFATHNEAMLTEGIKRLAKALQILRKTDKPDKASLSQTGLPII